MLTMALPAHIFSGLVWLDTGVLYIKDEESGRVNLTALLESLIGVQVNFTAHHIPDKGRPYAPGLGSCFAGNECGVGHHFMPYLLWDFQGNGVLERKSPGVWSVGGFLLEEKALVGHACRVVFVARPSTEEGKGIGDLHEEVSGLSELLSGLQKIIRENS